MRFIVSHGCLDVNAYATLGAHPPTYIPSCCPACACPGRLVGHGVRKRVAWLSCGKVVELYVRRLRCGCCRRAFTVLPAFLHPRKRYVLEVIEETLLARFGEHAASFAKLEAGPEGPSPPVQRDWCHGLVQSATQWLNALTHWMARLHPGLTASQRVRDCAAAGLLALLVQSADWCSETLGERPIVPGEVLETLWRWGHERVPVDLLAPTRSRAGPKAGQAQPLLIPP